MIPIGLLAEGRLDAAIGQKLVQTVGLELSTTFGQRGFAYFKRKIRGFNELAAGMPILALADFADAHAPCPPTAVRVLLPNPRDNCLLRLAVREAEAWLLADRQSMATFLSVPVGRITLLPEELEDPKAEVVALARRSRSASIRRLLAPDPRMNVSVGVGYVSHLNDFIADAWDPLRAQAHSPSLARAIAALISLGSRLGGG